MASHEFSRNRKKLWKGSHDLWEWNQKIEILGLGCILRFKAILINLKPFQLILDLKMSRTSKKWAFLEKLRVSMG